MRAARARRPDSVREYYAHPAVRQRIREYCGDAAGTGEFSCVSIAALTAAEGPAYRWEVAAFLPPRDLDRVLDEAADVARSLWDTRDILFYFDLDYHNQDHPGEAFAHPSDTFLAIEPVYRATRVVLRRFAIPALATVTGRGYHFVARIPRESPVALSLASLSRDPPAWWTTFERRRLAWMPPRIPEHDARAYTGLGMVTEHLAHLVLQRAVRQALLPVVLNGTAVGSGRLARESVSLDLSHFGDPLDQRHVRCAFSTYQLHLHRPDIFGSWPAHHVPPFATVVRSNGSLLALTDDGRTLPRAVQKARRSGAVLPDASRGMSRLVQHYRESKLARFHARYLREVEDSARTPTRDIALYALPPCVARPLQWPNDLLLRPEYIQHVTRYLLAAGWTAAQVAALVSSVYTRNGIWGSHWDRVEPTSRAEFDVRVFSGLHAAGVDRATDFNCVSAQEKGLCPHDTCRHDLRVERARLLERGEP